MPPKLSSQIVSAAISGFEQQKVEIDQQIAELRALLNGGAGPTAGSKEAPATKRRKMSAAARRRIAEGVRARWARIRGESKEPSPVAASKPKTKKRRISEEGLKRIIAATKKRWATVRAAQKSAAAPKPKRKLSGATRAKLIENLQRARAAKAAKLKAAAK